MAALDECVYLFIGHSPPPVIVAKRLLINIRILAAGADWEGPFSRRHKFGDGRSIPGDNDGLTLEHQIEQAGELGLGIVNFVAGHGPIY